MDRDLCLICQEKTLLKCPLNVEESSDKSKPYSSFLDSVKASRTLGILPVELAFGEDVRGSWHKSCHVKFSKEKLKRVVKKRD